MSQWHVKIYERKRNPDMNSKPVRVGRKMIPQDAVPRELSHIVISSNSIDGAKSETRTQLKKRGREVASISFSADQTKTIIAHVFEGKTGSMRKA